jgi:uncharacterized protein YcbK (DUF882 family)
MTLAPRLIFSTRLNITASLLAAHMAYCPANALPETHSEAIMKIDILRVQHELKAQERSNERAAEPKRIELLQKLLRKKMEQRELPAHPEIKVA